MGGFFTPGLTGRKSTCEFPCQPALSFLSGAEFGEVLSGVHLQPPGSPSPPPQRGAAARVRAGRGVEGNATDSCLPGAPGSASSAKPRRRLENFLKLPPPACCGTST